MQIGVDYYPEHWPEERWPEDARLMREAKISVVRLAEFSWCKLEPHEEEYDFSWLDRALAVLYQEGISAVLGTPTATPPAWLHEHYPDLYPMDARGWRLGFGTRLQRCLNHPVMRHYSRKITEKMVEHYRHHPAVIGWQIDNELEGNLCYCPICREQFQRWLQRKYGSLQELNRRWGTIFWSQEYTAWSQIPVPQEVRCGRSHNPALWLDFRRFASETTVSFQQEQIAIIRRLAPHQFITHNLMGLHDTLDYYALGRDLDFVAWDNYPSAGSNQADVSLAHDVMRGIKQKGFWVMEENVGIIGWERMGPAPAPGQTRAWAWQAISQGAETVSFFRWRSCLYGTEQYWHGILNHDGVPRRHYQEIAAFGQEVRELGPLLADSEVRAQVAILNSYEQNWAFQIQPQVEGLGWWEQVRAFHQALKSLGVDVDVVGEGADFSIYKLILVPSWYLLSPTMAQKFTDFVEQGGILVVNPRAGVKNLDNVCQIEPLPGLLTPLLGMVVEEYVPMPDHQGRVAFTGGGEFITKTWSDLLHPERAEVIATYREHWYAGKVAATRHQVGKGVAYYLGFLAEPAFYQAFVSQLVQAAGIPFTPALPPGVHLARRYRGTTVYTFLVNLTAESQSVPVQGQTILGPAPVQGKVDLLPYEVAIIAEDTKPPAVAHWR